MDINQIWRIQAANLSQPHYTSTHDLSKHAHLSVDQVRRECDKSYSPGIGSHRNDKIARKNARLCETFAGLGVTNIIIMNTPIAEDIPGGALHHIAPKEGRDLVVEKNYWSSFEHTKLMDVLEENNKHVLWVTGYRTCSCVFNTVGDAMTLRYDVRLISDRVGCAYPKCTNESIDVMQSWGVKIYTEREAIDSIVNPYKHAPRSWHWEMRPHNG